MPRLNKERQVKCIISRYDDTIKVPPFKTIPIDKVDLYEPVNSSDGGVDFCNRLYSACITKGYMFKFYTSSSVKDIDYEIVVD